MKRLLLDTNIYGLLAGDPEASFLIELCELKKEHFLVYGFSLIRKELRETSKKKTFLGRNLRVALLNLYDKITGNHILIVEPHLLLGIAENYLTTYRLLGGNFSKNELLKDFIIVACASKKGMDIVVSQDDATMLSDLALRAYTIVNTNLQLNNPKFLDYNEFKALLRR